VAIKKKAKRRPKLATDPKVQAAKQSVADRVEGRIAEITADKAKTDATVERVNDFVRRGQAAQKAVDEITQKFAAKQAAHDTVMANKNKRSGPSKTQVCDAVREGQPGLAFAAVDRIATAVMRLYGRE